MSLAADDWLVVRCRRHPDGTLRHEVLEVRDEVTAQRYVDKMSAGPDQVLMTAARVRRVVDRRDAAI
jgi:hypothetical protein